MMAALAGQQVMLAAGQRHGLNRPAGARPAAPRRSVRVLLGVKSPEATQARPSKLLDWLKDNGAPAQKVTLRTMERQGQAVDVTVAAQALQPGDVALRVPESLVVTLDRVFEDSTLSEMLTNGKLSELACLTLYLCYEKKKGPTSDWFTFIKELDRMAGRGPQGANSPLLWSEEEVHTLLAGSPVVNEVSERLKGIEKEYEELDTVWWMAGSLFKNYAFDIPTEQFSPEVFKQAFAAVQASVVHLQGVPLGKRFALVPLGPPLLSYSSTAKAMLRYDASSREVQLAVDRAYVEGEPVLAWCGPQSNSKLLLNYGIVDESNPYDKLPLSITIPSNDPLYRLKRDRLSEQGLSTQQTFQLARNAPLPTDLLPYLRLTNARSEEEAAKVQFGDSACPVSEANESEVLSQVISHLRLRLAAYRTTVEEDAAIIADPKAGPRLTVAARLVKIEKEILQQDLEQIMRLPGAAAAAELPMVRDSAINLGPASGALCG